MKNKAIEDNATIAKTLMTMNNIKVNDKIILDVSYGVFEISRTAKAKDVSDIDVSRCPNCLVMTKTVIKEYDIEFCGKCRRRKSTKDLYRDLCNKYGRSVIWRWNVEETCNVIEDLYELSKKTK